MTSKAEDGKFNDVADLVEDARKNGFDVLPPDVNKSNYQFKPEGAKGIRFGLAGIKGVGESAALVIQSEREKRGEYTDFFDLGGRLGKGTINKRVKEALINSGTLDAFGEREDLESSLEALQTFVETNEKAKSEQGTATAFDELLECTSEKPAIMIEKPELAKATEKWSMLDRLAREYKVFDFYFSGHPFDAYKQELGGLRGIENIADVPPGSQAIYVAGVVTDCVERKAKASGNPWGSLTLSDGKNEMNVALFGEAYANAKHKLKVGEFVTVAGRTKDELFQNKVQMTGELLFSKEETRTLTSQYLKIAVEDQDDAVKQVLDVLNGAPKGHENFGSQVLIYKRQSTGVPAKTNLGQPYFVQLTDSLMKELKAVTGENAVRLQAFNELAPPALAVRRQFKRR
jgi:DNA polymerase-3 subunit alpha